ncbi:hypothetical protein R83H12_03119 [Fibrobacteria bacterium R8-3-H12]
MLAKEIYAHLDSDFIKPEISDDWYRNFKKRDMGLVCD